MRHYQEDGFAWLQFLSGLGLSGVLADDMGLGKTVQALAHILAETERRPADQALPDRLPDQPGAHLAQRGAQVRPRPHRAGPARQPAPRAVRRDRGPRRGADQLRPAPARQGSPARAQIPDGRARRGAGDQEPGDQARPHRLPAQGRAPAGAVRHADGEPSGRALVGVPLPDAGLPGRPRDLPPRVPQPDREGGRRRPPAAAGQPRAPVPAAPHQGAGGLRAAAQAGGAPGDRAQRGPARPLRERAPVDAQAGARRDRAARPRPQQHRDPGGPAQAAPGLLRPAPAQERRRRPTSPAPSTSCSWTCCRAWSRPAAA